MLHNLHLDTLLFSEQRLPQLERHKTHIDDMYCHVSNMNVKKGTTSRSADESPNHNCG